MSEVPLYQSCCSARAGISLRARHLFPYRGTSLIRKRTPLAPYRRPMSRVIGGVIRRWASLMGEVPLFRGYSNIRFHAARRVVLGAWA